MDLLIATENKNEWPKVNFRLISKIEMSQKRNILPGEGKT